MEAKEKAIELVELYCQLLAIRSYENKDKAKQCALICVDEIINQFTNKCCESANVRYWKEVKEEINNL